MVRCLRSTRRCRDEILGSRRSRPFATYLFLSRTCSFFFRNLQLRPCCLTTMTFYFPSLTELVPLVGCLVLNLGGQRSIPSGNTCFSFCLAPAHPLFKFRYSDNTLVIKDSEFSMVASLRLSLVSFKNSIQLSWLHHRSTRRISRDQNPPASALKTTPFSYFVLIFGIANVSNLYNLKLS